MKYNVLLVSLTLIFLVGCEDDSPTAKYFPILRTIRVSDITSSGATFEGEIVKNGYTPTSSYGFIWDTQEPNINKSFKVILGEKANESTFKVRIDSTLVPDLEYYVRAFATYENTTIYGEVKKFVSKGSLINLWSLETEGNKLDGWFTSYGCSNTDAGYIIFQSSEVYSYNPEEREISESTNFPVSGNSGTQFTNVAVDNDLYLFSNLNRYLYKFQAGSWSQESTTPFHYGSYYGYYHGFAVDNNIYILSSYNSYVYNIESKTWNTRANFPEISAGGTDINNKVYVMSTNKNIYEYNTVTDNWILKTQYPGIYNDIIISFSYSNLLFFGLSYHDHSNNDFFDRNFWIYDLVSNTWKKTQRFPIELTGGDIFYFNIKDNLYIGTQNIEGYMIWKFDPSKI